METHTSRQIDAPPLPHCDPDELKLSLDLHLNQERLRTHKNRKHQKIRQRSERVTPHPSVPMPICFLYPAFVEKHIERQKGIKPQGMTIVTVSSALSLASTPVSALSSSLSWQVGEAKEMLGCGWYISHDGWSCCPPH